MPQSIPQCYEFVAKKLEEPINDAFEKTPETALSQFLLVERDEAFSQPLPCHPGLGRNSL